MALTNIFMKGSINMKDKSATKIHQSQPLDLFSMSDYDLGRLRQCKIKKLAHSCWKIRKYFVSTSKMPEKVNIHHNFLSEKLDYFTLLHIVNACKKILRFRCNDASSIDVDENKANKGEV